MPKHTPSARPRSLREVALEEIDAATAALGADPSDAAVHTARKACKRIRATLRLSAAAIGPARYRRENHRIRDAGKPLTAVRDAFVMRRTAGSLAFLPADVRGELDSNYATERGSMHRHGARDALELLHAARARIEAAPAEQADRSSAIAGLKKTYRAGRKAYARARGAADDELHECRKQAKYLLNELDVLRVMFDVRLRKLHRRADVLGETLGADHDLAVLLGKLRPAEPAHRAAARRLQKKRHALQSRALRQGKKLYRRSVKHVARQLRRRLPD